MKIARNNLMTADNGVLTVIDDANVNYDPLNVLDPSFSTVYNGAGTGVSLVFRYTFDTPTSISYVAVAGHNAGVTGNAIGFRIDAVPMLSREYEIGDFNSVLMMTFPEQVVTVVDVIFTKRGPVTDRVVLANFQCGNVFSFQDPINNSEESGYVRPWIASGVRAKAILNRQSEPSVSLVQQETKRITLTIRNIQGIDANPDFDQLTEFFSLMTDKTTWFMQERDDTVEAQDGESNYLCFNGEVQVVAGANRLLNTFKLSFNAYIGSRA